MPRYIFVFLLNMFISFKSFNLNLLEYFVLKLFKIKNNISYRIINLPVKKKKWSVLRSPHVHSKSKEQFEMCVFNRLLILDTFNFKEKIRFFNTIKNRLVPGISVRFKYV